MASERGGDLGQKLIAHDAVAEFDGSGETFGIGPAMAFDDDAVEPEKNAAIGRGADPCAGAAAGMPSGRTNIRSGQLSDCLIARSEIFADLARGAFGGLERDVAGKAFGDDDIDRTLADIVAFDEAD